MMKNIMYVGILRSGESQSGIFPELQIIDADTLALLEDCEQFMTGIYKDYNCILSWADVYKDSTTEAKRMILAQPIDRGNRMEGLRLEIKSKISYEQFQNVIVDNEARLTA